MKTQEIKAKTRSGQEFTFQLGFDSHGDIYATHENVTGQMKPEITQSKGAFIAAN